MQQQLNYLENITRSLYVTFWDVLPIILVLSFFQFLVIRKAIPHLRRILIGLAMVVVGLAIFLVGLEEGIFPLGTSMAKQLSDPAFLSAGNQKLFLPTQVSSYFWVILFAFSIGFATALAEPALIAVAMKAEDISTGAISAGGLRIAVALGAGTGIALGSFRIVMGTPLQYYIITGYVFLLVQTYFAPRFIIPLAYDLGGVTTSTVTVPMVVALGLGLASNVPGASPLLDGFGLIAFAALFPMITVLAYAMITARRAAIKTNETNSPEE